MVLRPTTPSAMGFARLDPVHLQNCFVSWPPAIAELLPGEAVAIAG